MMPVNTARPQPGRRAAFIDRDGVINVESGFVHRLEDLVFLPGAIEGLRRLQAAGYLLVVITNQSGIARGLYSEADYLQLTAGMQQRLAAAGVQLSTVEYCPHLPDGEIERYRRDCDCRKPKPGLLLRGIEQYNIDPAQSYFIGDRERDVEAGEAAGVTGILINSDQPISEVLHLIK